MKRMRKDLEAIARMEAMAIRMESIAIRIEAIASRSEACY